MSSAPTTHVEVRLYGDLGWFVDAADRDGTADLPIGERRSIKDLLESNGLPHVEVGGVLVDGQPATLGDIVAPGSRLSVYPAGHDLAPAGNDASPSPEPRRFVADVHLGTLARRLRILGFDTWYEVAADDAELARRSVTEDRIVLTRDRQLLMRREILHGYCPRAPDPDEQLEEVVARWGLASRAHPATRCPACNGLLVAAGLDEVRGQIPPRTAREHDRFARCPDCGQVYWPGSHLDALEERHPDLFGAVRRGQQLT